MSVLNERKEVTEVSIKDLLTSSPDAQPVIFFRSVTFSELESLVNFIYSGKARSVMLIPIG